MGRRRNAQWLEPGKATRNAGAMPKHDSREALWESYVRYDDGKRQLNVAMAGWAMGDQEIDHWCKWFGSHLQRLTGGRHDQIWAKEVNFAENQLTAVGARRLLETLAEGKVYAFVLKLHHNQLEDGECVADYITHCQGSLRELHLSHNEMPTEAAAQIIIAAVSVRDDDSGAFCYPCRSGGHSAAPLWLRLEQNYVVPAALASLTDPPFEEIRSGKVLCNVSSRACTPHCCVKHRVDPPPVHAKHLSNQRTKSASPTSAAGAKDLLTMLRSGVRDDNPEKRQQASNGSAAGGETPASGNLRTLIGKESVPEAICTVAKVLRWDDDLLKWVHDVIEIPEEPQKANDDSGRVKLSSELGLQLGNELKNLLGGGRSSNGSVHQRPSNSKSFRTSGAHMAREDQGSSGMHATGSDYAGRQGGAMDDEPEHAYRSNRRGRRGSQPSGSEVKQVNGTMLNPAAKEFVPDAPHRVKALELNLQAATFSEDVDTRPASSDDLEFDGINVTIAAAASASTSSSLNPEAAEFKPTGTTICEEMLKSDEPWASAAETTTSVTGSAAALEQGTPPSFDEDASETGAPQEASPQEGAATYEASSITLAEEVPHAEPAPSQPPASPDAGYVSFSNGNLNTPIAEAALPPNAEHEGGGLPDTEDSSNCSSTAPDKTEDDSNCSSTAPGKGIFSVWNVLEKVGLAPAAGEAKPQQQSK